MLPRVSAALSQFIKPISSSSQQQAVTEKKHGEEKSGFQPFQQESKKSKLKLVDSQETQETKAPQPSLSAVAPTPPRNLSVAHSFLQLLVSLQKKQTVLTYLRGVQVYFSSAKSNKKLKRLRKGTIVDERLE